MTTTTVTELLLKFTLCVMFFLSAYLARWPIIILLSNESVWYSKVPAYMHEVLIDTKLDFLHVLLTKT